MTKKLNFYLIVESIKHEVEGSPSVSSPAMRRFGTKNQTFCSQESESAEAGKGSSAKIKTKLIHAKI